MKKKGFTLLELIIGMAIVAVLATLGIAGISVVQRSTRDTERRKTLEQINLQLEDMKGPLGRYPELVGRPTASTTNELRICAVSSCTNTVVRTIELKGSAVLFTTNPSDGRTTSEGTVYCYTRTSNGSAFSVGVSLEGGDAFYLGSATPCSFTSNAL